MKKSIRLIICAAVLAAVLAGAYFLYGALKDGYRDEHPEAEAAGTKALAADDTASKTAGTENNSAPDFTVLSKDGKTVSFSGFSGKPVVINFWATWCPPCCSELGTFDKYAKKYKDDVVFMMINLTDGARDSVESVSEFVSDAGYTFPLYFDTTQEAAGAYGVYYIPESVFIDRNGNITDTYTGALDEYTLESSIEKIIG